MKYSKEFEELSKDHVHAKWKLVIGVFIHFQMFHCSIRIRDVAILSMQKTKAISVGAQSISITGQPWGLAPEISHQNSWQLVDAGTCGCVNSEDHGFNRRPQISEGSLGPQPTQVALWSVVMSDQRGWLGEGSAGTLFRFCSGNNLPLSASWLSAISSNYLSEI